MVTTEKVRTTKEERESIVQKAVDLFNLTFDVWGITTRKSVICIKTDEVDEDTRPLRTDDIKLTQVTSKLGHVTDVPGDTPEESYWKLGVNMKNWRNHMPVNDKTAFLLHELSHLPVANTAHDSAYWNMFATVLQNAIVKKEEVSEIMGGEIRGDTLRDRAAAGIRVADDVTNTQEQMKSFCDSIDYDPKYVGAFGDQRISFAEKATNEATDTVSASELTVDDEIRDWRLYSVMDKQSPVGYRTGDMVKFTTPLLVEDELTDDGRKVAKRGYAAEARIALLKRIDNYSSREIPKIPIQTAEERDNQQ